MTTGASTSNHSHVNEDNMKLTDEELQLEDNYNDNIDQDHDEEVQLYHMPFSKKPNLKLKVLLCGTGAILVTILLLVCTLSIVLPIVLTHNGDSDHDNEVIHTTTEFQIKLPNLSEWKSRESEMKKWMETFEEASSYFSLEDSIPASNIRGQYYVDTDGSDRCGINHEIRVREYISGSQEGATTVDIKGNKKIEFLARRLPFWPAPEYVDQSSQKCEKDVHAHDHKYSRETRITMDSPVTFETCLDVAKLFPYAYDVKMNVAMHDLKVSSSRDYWMVQEFAGYLDNDTKYKVAFTLKYDSLKDAQNDHKPHSGEWSIRIYALKDGNSLQYNQNVVDDVTQAWRALISTYDADE